MKRLILASKSPRRKELLALCGFDFSTVPADIDEEKITDSILRDINNENRFSELVMELSYQKAKHVFKENGDAIVIGSDTVVVCDGKVFGKPKSKDDAKKMLTDLSGAEHIVYTGVAILSNGLKDVFYDATVVKFHEYNDYMKNLIDEYIASGDPFDKAGSYGIQGAGSLLIESIKGDFYSVMGLPVSRVSRALDAFK
ncbi:Maf family protein [Microaceticoccus formicicus]|uniref:Maf family protein n=1 Tax=Microaceticoccus formicicus TaxID=3118105 RepID=UPI003CD02F5C|nr:nucleoside triphosphate pyrophosphatase [Peptoniphilaceae bacterium AMB_02]